MDKKAWIAVSLSVIGLVLSQFYLTKHAPPPAPRPVATAPAMAPGVPPIVEPVRREAVGDQKSAEPVPAVPVAERFETLELPGMVVRFTNLGGGIADVALLGHQHLAANGEPVKLNASGHIPIGALSPRPGEGTNAPYEMRRESDRAVVFEQTTPEGLRVFKRFTVQPAPDSKSLPALNLELTVTNPGAVPVRADNFLHLGSAAPIHRADAPDFTELLYWRNGQLAEASARYFDAGHLPILGIQTSPARALYNEPVDHLSWVGVKNQFYTTIFTPAAPEGKQGAARAVWARRFVVPPTTASEGLNGAAVYGLDVALGLPTLELAANGGTTTQVFQIYAGPTQYDRISQLGRGDRRFDKDQAEVLKYGKFTKPVSIFLLNSMNWLQGHLGNYALAIVALTILLKIVLLWPQTKAMASGRRMAALGPKMKELKAKYPDDPAKAQQETLKLYKDYGVNPVGGCLPALIQMPIFFGFFRMLGNAAELRNAGFLWVKDLTQPDTIGNFLGYPVNILPLLYAGTMLWQLSLTPKPADPQQAQQQKIMMFIPLVFVVFFYNFAAALSLYYTMQNLLMIVHLYIIKNQPTPVLTKVEPGAGGKGGGFGAMLSKLTNPPGSDRDASPAATPRGKGAVPVKTGKNGARRARI